MEQVKSLVVDIVGEIKDINHIINLEHPSASTTTLVDEQDVVDIEQMINTITTSTSVNQFIIDATQASSSSTSRPLNDDELISMIKNHAKHMQLRPYVGKSKFGDVFVDTEEFKSIVSFVFNSGSLHKKEHTKMYIEMLKSIITFDLKQHKEYGIVQPKTRLQTQLLLVCREEYEKVSKLLETFDALPIKHTEAQRMEFMLREFKIDGVYNFIGELYNACLLDDRLISDILNDNLGTTTNHPIKTKVTCVCSLMESVGKKLSTINNAALDCRSTEGQRME
ncbi:hypothetical protein SAMD00019534_056760 [Acytostelium subglobosum LB1]|uniref:hypothetical protein n=1 Tax=Acytostelium subglobosum LB1 TaxID=1410327 RepID=UPI0006450CBA|nr:hypothetical protein SAMD00019534_056760 [Acytostelium subglobosum LB1]GAM22501.1 hypothetical protein SAMD00019534_056760 [Acytostelium subglobosum LB1]|eukprot:XP_012754621.1 hypothetical protein SAMD00019534_056760 [Acytostelium subglobosum LB1]